MFVNVTRLFRVKIHVDSGGTRCHGNLSVSRDLFAAKCRHRGRRACMGGGS